MISALFAVNNLTQQDFNVNLILFFRFTFYNTVYNYVNLPFTNDIVNFHFQIPSLMLY